jgi:DNA uptake protein ComE-like DNA-binding protein
MIINDLFIKGRSYFMEENSLMWKVVNLLWVIFSFIFVLNGLGIIYAAKKVDNRNWLIEGIIYQAIAIMLLLLAGFNVSSIGVAFTLFYLLSWLICIIRTPFIAKKYLEILRLKNNSNMNYQQTNQDNQNPIQNESNVNINSQNVDLNGNVPPAQSYVYENEMQFNKAQTYNNSNINQDILNKNNADTADNMNNDYDPQRIDDTSQTIQENISKINLNTASAEEIKNIPILTVEQAQKIIELRSRGETIRSMDDLKQKFNMDDTQIAQLKEYIIIKDVGQSRRIDM